MSSFKLSPCSYWQLDTPSSLFDLKLWVYGIFKEVDFWTKMTITTLQALPTLIPKERGRTTRARSMRHAHWCVWEKRNNERKVADQIVVGEGSKGKMKQGVPTGVKMINCQVWVKNSLLPWDKGLDYFNAAPIRTEGARANDCASWLIDICWNKFNRFYWRVVKYNTTSYSLLTFKIEFMTALEVLRWKQLLSFFNINSVSNVCLFVFFSGKHQTSCSGWFPLLLDTASIWDSMPGSTAAEAETRSAFLENDAIWIHVITRF